MKAELAVEDAEHEARQLRKKLDKLERMAEQPPRLGKHKFKPEPLQVMSVGSFSCVLEMSCRISPRTRFGGCNLHFVLHSRVRSKSVCAVDLELLLFALWHVLCTQSPLPARGRGPRVVFRRGRIFESLSPGAACNHLCMCMHACPHAGHFAIPTCPLCRDTWQWQAMFPLSCMCPALLPAP